MKNEVLVLASAEDLKKFFDKYVEENVLIISPRLENDEMNQKQAAKWLGVSEATIINYKKEGKIPYEQLPGSTKVRYYKSELKKTVSHNRHLLQPSRK